MQVDKLSFIKEELESCHSSYNAQDILNYITYLQEASTLQRNGRLVNAWMNKITAAKYVFLFKKVASTGLVIDGDTITLGYLGGNVTVNYDYRAYKNRVLSNYPETLFDFQLVKTGDSFKFSKDNGKVNYSHDILSAFDDKAETIGAYGVVKNSRGEFIELINKADIAKIRSTAKTDFIWKQWTDRMILKSIIKRICKTHFSDITAKLDKLDNIDNYDVSPRESQEEIDRKEELKRAIEYIKGSKTLDQLEKVKLFVEENHDEENKLSTLYNTREYEITQEKIEA